MNIRINQEFSGSLDPDRVSRRFLAELKRLREAPAHTHLMPKRPVANPSKVPARQWRRWTDRAKQVFNAVYLQMRTDQQLFLHPDARPLPLKLWKTTCYNAAWIAADAVDGR